VSTESGARWNGWNTTERSEWSISPRTILHFFVDTMPHRLCTKQRRQQQQQQQQHAVGYRYSKARQKKKEKQATNLQHNQRHFVRNHLAGAARFNCKVFFARAAKSIFSWPSSGIYSPEAMQWTVILGWNSRPLRSLGVMRKYWLPPRPSSRAAAQAMATRRAWTRL
jgi:hypothetical protein